MAAAALSFGVADLIGGSGFLAVYLVGLAVGSTPSRYRRQLVAFHEGLAFLAQVAMFVVLGLLVFPSDLPDVALPGLGLATLLVVVIRPAAVWLSTAFSTFTAPRAPPPRLGRPSRRRPDRARDVRALVRPRERRDDLQRRLLRRRRVGAPAGDDARMGRAPARPRRSSPGVAAPPLEVDALGHLELVEFDVAGDHAIAGAAVRELGLPRTALVAVVARRGETIPPRGSTVIESGDRLFVLARRGSRGDLEDVFARWRRRV